MTTEQTDRTPPKPARSYHALGRSGLRVSPFCRGTMTFGVDQWGNDIPGSRAIFDAYIDAGGNFFDTSDIYSNGISETILGSFVKEHGGRDRLVLATKFGFSMDHSDPNAGGNSRKHITAAVEASLKRLQTDYIDLYWGHVWDRVTPPEELMATLDTLVRAGKIRYFGLSNFPAWYIGKAQTLAELKNLTPLCALQMEYSLVMRNIEREFVPAALELGLGICPWSPLGAGILTGKYHRPVDGSIGEGRLQAWRDSPNPVFEKLTEPNFKIVDVVVEVANELNKTPSQIALNWITRRPGVSSTIIGATKIQQLHDNMSSLDFQIPPELSAKLESISRPVLDYPQVFWEGYTQEQVHGKNRVTAEPEWYRR